ncbi:MAG: FAD-dependent oxidoreductase [Proteobacteria bacterium]|jgi:flavin-dependent dehydrogenase|nr:FAD-dependent oxidoreductase [Pseudomonadota bacterium]
MKIDVDVAVIGAGPAGSVSASMLAEKGHSVMVIEAAQFPRFSIGESLLPQVTECLQTAGLLDAVSSAGFQYKDGAHFVCGDLRETFLFEQKSAPGPFHAWEVKRADFDHILAQEAEKRGAEISYNTRVLSWKRQDGETLLGCRKDEEDFTVNCRFLIDASGFGRVMSRLADLEYPSNLPPRRAIFQHVKHHITSSDFDPDKITIAQSQMDLPYWFWMIPFSDQTASLGLVCDPNNEPNECLETTLAEHIETVPLLSKWLVNAEPVTVIGSINGYSCNVKNLFGDKFVLLGNAAEFVDPIFSSGVSIACRSAILAVPLIERELKGENIDWLREYEEPMRRGVKVFHTFVEAWYEGTLSRLFYAETKNAQYKSYICSILAGYVWDENNPVTRFNLSKLRTMANAIDS